MALIRQILENEYYQNEIRPQLDVEKCVGALVNEDVVDVRTFFLREQVIGELRTIVRMREMLEGRYKELMKMTSEGVERVIDEYGTDSD